MQPHKRNLILNSRQINVPVPFTVASEPLALQRIFYSPVACISA
jgi:hypothetical protein